MKLTLHHTLLLGMLALNVWGLGASPVAAQNLPWAEPRALSVVDIAGQVPDSALAGHIVCYGNPGGMLTYQNAWWEGNKLRIRLRVHPRYVWENDQVGWATAVALLGHKPVLDRMSSSAPAASVRLYRDNADVTSQVVYFFYTDPNVILPSNPTGDPRYSAAQTGVPVSQPIPSDGIPVPANWGGHMVLYGIYENLTAVYTVPDMSRPTVRYIGEESFDYPSYIGPGFVGWFEPLMRQMRSRYADRHPRVMLQVPPEANYVLFVYDPMPYDNETGYWARDEQLYERNYRQGVAGTARMAPDAGMLSQDLNHGGPFPLDVWWQDADQSAGPYLSVFTSSQRPIDRLTPPEFVVLPGTPYNPCFKNGGCSNAVLQDIYDRRATIRVVYLKVEPLTSGMQPIPLRIADTNWIPGSQAILNYRWDATMTRRLSLPLIFTSQPMPVLPTERPLGFFDPISGRMVGYLAE